MLAREGTRAADFGGETGEDLVVGEGDAALAFGADVVLDPEDFLVGLLAAKRATG